MRLFEVWYQYVRKFRVRFVRMKFQAHSMFPSCGIYQVHLTAAVHACVSNGKTLFGGRPFFASCHTTLTRARTYLVSARYPNIGWSWRGGVRADDLESTRKNAERPFVLYLAPGCNVLRTWYILLYRYVQETLDSAQVQLAEYSRLVPVVLPTYVLL